MSFFPLYVYIKYPISFLFSYANIYLISITLVVYDFMLHAKFNYIPILKEVVGIFGVSNAQKCHKWLFFLLLRFLSLVHLKKNNMNL